LVASQGVLYIEADRPWDLPLSGFRPWRQTRAGAVWAQVLRRDG
jgi:hypothetical protein